MCDKCETAPGVILWQGSIPLEGADGLRFRNNRQLYRIIKCPTTRQISVLRYREAIGFMGRRINKPYQPLEDCERIPSYVLGIMAEFKMELQ